MERQTERLILTARACGAQADELQAPFVAGCGRRPGLQLRRTDDVVSISIDPRWIEAIGPRLEAVAGELDIELRIDQLDAALPSADLDGRPSRVWAAIGNAADEISVLRERGEEPPFGLLRHVAVEEQSGDRIAVDARRCIVEPVGGPAPDASPTKYDDAGWHADEAVEAGEAPEQGFVHIGLLLTWLGRRNLLSRELPRRIRVMLETGPLDVGRLVSATDGKLLSIFLTSDGEAFCDARYDTYLRAFEEAVRDAPPFSVRLDETWLARVTPRIDQLWEDWDTAGRPPAEPNPAPIDVPHNLAAGLIETIADLAALAAGPEADVSSQPEAVRKRRLIDALASRRTSIRLHAIGELRSWRPDPEVVAALVPMLRVDDPDARLLAAAGIATQGDLAALGELVALVEREASGGSPAAMLVALTAALALASRRDASAADEVREKARRWRGPSPAQRDSFDLELDQILGA